MIRSFIIIVLLSCNVLAVYAQGNKKDYYNVPNPINFDNRQYYMSDAYHPQYNYYKQEYIPKGETAEQFNTMITIDILTGGATVKGMAEQKAAEIEGLKGTDPVARYTIYEHPETGEYFLDFLISSSDGNKVSVVEWNGYRYTSYTDKSGKNGVMLFAYSWRGYGNDINGFFKKLKTKRPDYINMLVAYKLPKIELGN